MIDLDAVKPGRLATVLLKGEHTMNKGGRKGVALNPLLGRVTRDHRLVVTIAGPETYNHIYPLRNGGEEAPGKEPWFVWVKDGVVAHKTTGELYLAAVPTSAKRTTRFLVDGRDATPEELETIRDYTPEKEAPGFLCFKLENVSNLAD